MSHDVSGRGAGQIDPLWQFFDADARESAELLVDAIGSVGGNFGNGEATVETRGLVAGFDVCSRNTKQAGQLLNQGVLLIGINEATVDHQSGNEAARNHHHSVPVKDVAPGGFAPNLDPGLLFDDFRALSTFGDLYEPEPNSDHTEHGEKERGKNG